MVNNKKTRERKLNVLQDLLARSDKLEDIKFTYWLETMPEGFAPDWERVHPTKAQIKENELQVNITNQEIIKICEELAKLYKEAMPESQIGEIYQGFAREMIKLEEEKILLRQ